MYWWGGVKLLILILPQFFSLALARSISLSHLTSRSLCVFRLPINPVQDGGVIAGGNYRGDVQVVLVPDVQRVRRDPDVLEPPEPRAVVIRQHQIASTAQQPTRAHAWALSGVCHTAREGRYKADQQAEKWPKTVLPYSVVDMFSTAASPAIASSVVQLAFMSCGSVFTSLLQTPLGAGEASLSIHCCRVLCVAYAFFRLGQTPADANWAQRQIASTTQHPITYSAHRAHRSARHIARHIAQHIARQIARQIARHIARRV